MTEEQMGRLVAGDRVVLNRAGPVGLSVGDVGVVLDPPREWFMSHVGVRVDFSGYYWLIKPDRLDLKGAGG